MGLNIQNTLSKKKENFTPIKDKQVNVFCCGPTVYDYSHIGHAKTYIQFDIIVKYLRYLKYKVFYLQNITDIDDKIILRAKEQGTDPKELAKQFTKEYFKDMVSLHVNSIDKYAPATEYIENIISQVQRLIDKGYAYETSDGIYFEINKFKRYGQLSKQNKEDLTKSRIKCNEEKKDSHDFVIWKKHKKGEPFWKSPFGDGRPGWHIEDTAITEKEFGFQYDLHGGGEDLIFPHHEAEIAQMEAISEKIPFVKYWTHMGFLQVEGEKMSKSLRNFLTIKDALKKNSPETLRFFFASTHYRSPINYSEKSLEYAKNSLERLQNFVNNLKNAKGKSNQEIIKMINSTKKSFEEAMNDDFNTSGALGSIFEFVKETNILMSKEKLSKEDAQKVESFLKEFNSVFNILSFKEIELPKEIIDLAQEREEARKSKNWDLSDKLRAQIEKKGYSIKDSKNGQIVHKI